MDRDQARKMKEQLAAFARELAEKHGVVATPRSLGAQTESEAADVVRAPTLALGLVPQAEGGFGIAVRYRLGVPRARSIVRKVSAEIGPEVDVRRTGRIRPVSELGPRPPAPTSQADGDTDRRRPLRPGISIGHVGVTAGTLGAFVTRAVPGGGDRAGDDAGDGQLYALSNYHVLAGSPEARPGDIVLQPGPADGGLAPGDRIGELTQVVDLDALEPAYTDAAIARLDRVPVDFDYPVGRVVKTARALGGEIVGKVGRTTSVTRGRVTAIELDDVIVGYEDLGALASTTRSRSRVSTTSRSPAAATRVPSCTGRTAWRSASCSPGRSPAGPAARGSPMPTRSTRCWRSWGWSWPGSHPARSRDVDPVRGCSVCAPAFPGPGVSVRRPGDVGVSARRVDRRHPADLRSTAGHAEGRVTGRQRRRGGRHGGHNG